MSCQREQPDADRRLPQDEHVRSIKANAAAGQAESTATAPNTTANQTIQCLWQDMPDLDGNQVVTSPSTGVVEFKVCYAAPACRKYEHRFESDKQTLVIKKYDIHKCMKHLSAYCPQGRLENVPADTYTFRVVGGGYAGNKDVEIFKTTVQVR